MNEAKTFTFDKLPMDLEELKALPMADLKDAHGVAALTILALNAYKNNADEAIKMLQYLKGPQELSAYDKTFIRDRFSDKKEYFMHSYFEGATPQNGYTPSMPYTLKIYENPYSRDQFDGGYLKVFVKSGGADSERPMTLRTKPSTGEWFIWENAGVLASIRTAACDDPWA